MYINLVHKSSARGPLVRNLSHQKWPSSTVNHCCA